MEVCEMLWFIAAGIVWFLGCGFYFCLMTVAKRADEIAESMYHKEMFEKMESKLKRTEII
jgi:hypothetical protein